LQRGNAFTFEAVSLQAPFSIRILDLQGRNVRTLLMGRTGLLAWDGKDATGKPVPYGTYFVRVKDAQVSGQRINVLP
jgi:hypothetical protein